MSFSSRLAECFDARTEQVSGLAGAARGRAAGRGQRADLDEDPRHVVAGDVEAAAGRWHLPELAGVRAGGAEAVRDVFVVADHVLDGAVEGGERLAPDDDGLGERVRSAGSSRSRACTT
jgi:hypothetical protein